MRIARALISDKGIITINLDKDIASLDLAKFNDNEDLLRKELEKEKDNNIIGISEFNIGKILFKNDNTYKCELYVSTKVIEGIWSID